MKCMNFEYHHHLFKAEFKKKLKKNLKKLYKCINCENNCSWIIKILISHYMTKYTSITRSICMASQSPRRAGVLGTESLTQVVDLKHTNATISNKMTDIS